MLYVTFFLLTLILILQNSLAFCKTAPVEYFNNFYNEYLKARKVNCNDRIILDFLYQITDKKVSLLQNLLENAQNDAEKKEVALLLDEEYKEFSENMNFEISGQKNKSLSLRQKKKFKKAHKKFLHSISRNL